MYDLRNASSNWLSSGLSSSSHHIVPSRYSSLGIDKLFFSTTVASFTGPLDRRRLVAPSSKTCGHGDSPGSVGVKPSVFLDLPHPCSAGSPV